MLAFAVAALLACTRDPTTGCCAGTDSCPACCMYASVSGTAEGGVRCACHGCPSSPTTVAPTCNPDRCGEEAVASLNFPSFGCRVCVGANATCFPDAAAARACGALQSEVAGETCSYGEEEEEAQPCFPSSASVELRGGARVRLDALRVGDEVRSVDLAGRPSVGRVSALSVRRPDARAVVWRVTTEAGGVLHATADHHVASGAACCAHVVRVRTLRPGDVLWTSVNGTRASPVRVSSVRSGVDAVGLHSPVLSNGDHPVVDGVVTSFDRIAVVRLARTVGLGWVEALCHAVGWC